MEPERASEVNFHLENSEGGQGLGVQWKAWSAGPGGGGHSEPVGYHLFRSPPTPVRDEGPAARAAPALEEEMEAEVFLFQTASRPFSEPPHPQIASQNLPSPHGASCTCCPRGQTLPPL